MVKNRQKETRKTHHHKFSSSEDSDDSDGNDMSSHKLPRLNSLLRCGQSPAPAHHRDDDKVSPDEEAMNRN